jgi:hypothetical protein
MSSWAGMWDEGEGGLAVEEVWLEGAGDATPEASNADAGSIPFMLTKVIPRLFCKLSAIYHLFPAPPTHRVLALLCDPS